MDGQAGLQRPRPPQRPHQNLHQPSCQGAVLHQVESGARAHVPQRRLRLLQEQRPDQWAAGKGDAGSGEQERALHCALEGLLSRGKVLIPASCNRNELVEQSQRKVIDAVSTSLLRCSLYAASWRALSRGSWKSGMCSSGGFTRPVTGLLYRRRNAGGQSSAIIHPSASTRC